MKLCDVLPHFGGEKKQLADALKITKQAVSRWPEDQPIPEKQELKIRHELLPEVFGPGVKQIE